MPKKKALDTAKLIKMIEDETPQAVRRPGTSIHISGSFASNP